MIYQNTTVPSGKKISLERNLPLRRNTFIFGISMILLQVGISAIYGTLITIPNAQLKIPSVIMMILLAILIIAGFGLVFGYTKRLLWSGIGFTLLITAISIQLYPLINDFWTKVGLQNEGVSPITNFNYQNRRYNIFLTDRQEVVSGQRTFYGNSLINALKCGLSLSIAFSSILGRAGQLQALIVTIFGTVTFELNRMIIQNKRGMDSFGTYFIFTFGGFMGLGLGLFLHLRQRKAQHLYSAQSMKRYNASQPSAFYAGLGSLVIFALFPILAYQSDAFNPFNAYNPYTNPLCIIAGLGSGAVGALFITTLMNGIIIFRDLIHGVIAGAIVVGASSLYISNPLYAIVAGITGGIIQTVIQNVIERSAAKRRIIISTVSWSLFGIQGLVGAAFAAGWKAVLYNSKHGLTVQAAVLHTNGSQYQFYGGLISAGIGAATGIVIGALVYLINSNGENDYFEDCVYWYRHDYLNKQVRVEHPPQTPAKIPKEPIIQSVSSKSSETQKPQQQYQPQEQLDHQFSFSEQSNKDYNEFSYL